MSSIPQDDNYWNTPKAYWLSGGFCLATAAFGILSFAIWPEFWSLYDFMFTLMGVLVIGTPLVLAAFCFWHARELKKQQGEIAYPEK